MPSVSGLVSQGGRLGYTLFRPLVPWALQQWPEDVTNWIFGQLKVA